MPTITGSISKKRQLSPSPAWQAAVDSFLDDFYDLAILTPEAYKAERDPAQRAPKIFVQHPNPRPPQPRRRAAFRRRPPSKA